jgi:hypothetical protein
MMRSRPALHMDAKRYERQRVLRIDTLTAPAVSCTRPRGIEAPGSPGFYSPAAARSACALSVRSQVNSGSSRPKWPYAAVFS